MNQRLVAAMVAIPLVLGLFVYALVARLPYATFSPGGTVNVLGDGEGGAAIIQVTGHRTYPDDGQLRMTTVGVSPVEPKGMGLGSLLGDWFDDDDAVYPYSFVHPDDISDDEDRRQGALQMATSQDNAVKVALTELGYDVPTVLKVLQLSKGLPASKVLQVGDVVDSVNGTEIEGTAKLAADDQVKQLVRAAPAGRPIVLGITRGGKDRTVRITPIEEQGVNVVGISQFGFDFDFPFDVSINISSDIGGPSAGLMFALSVYDYLSPGSLTGGHVIAGTGEIDPDGVVGPIGGIQQKIAGAREAGAQLFIVPKDNCDDAAGAHAGDMRLMMGTTMHEVRTALEKYAADSHADLPTCGDAS